MSILATDSVLETNLQAVRNLQLCLSKFYTQEEELGKETGEQVFRQVKNKKRKENTSLRGLRIRQLGR